MTEWAGNDKAQLGKVSLSLALSLTDTHYKSPLLYLASWNRCHITQTDSKFTCNYVPNTLHTTYIRHGWLAVFTQQHHFCSEMRTIQTANELFARKIRGRLWGNERHGLIPGFIWAIDWCGNLCHLHGFVKQMSAYKESSNRQAENTMTEKQTEHMYSAAVSPFYSPLFLSSRSLISGSGIIC